MHYNHFSCGTENAESQPFGGTKVTGVVRRSRASDPSTLQDTRGGGCGTFLQDGEKPRFGDRQVHDGSLDHLRVSQG